MKKLKVLFVALGLFLGILTPAAAQVRIDPIITVPFYMGFNIDDGKGGTLKSGSDMPSVIPFPEVQFHYVFGGNAPLRLGVGGRVFTALLVSMATPNVFLEADLGPVVFNLSVAGLWYGFFGLVQTSATGAVIIPDLSVEWDIAESFRLGAGVMAFGNYNDIERNNFYSVYIRARFPILIGGETQETTQQPKTSSEESK